MYAFAFFHPTAAKSEQLAGETPFGKDEEENEA